MADPIWYLGPAGDMRPLVCPERDIDITEERYGGVFQGLSGARSMTVTGHKQRYTLEFRYLSKDEYAWLEALHKRSVFGLYRLQNPFKVNMLSNQASLVRTVGDNRTVQFSSGVTAPAPTDWPSAAGSFANISTKWTNRSTGTQIFRVEERFNIPVVAGVPVSFSIYIRSSTSMTGNTVIDWYDQFGTQVGSGGSTPTSLTTSWQRFTSTATPPVGAVKARGAFLTATTAPDIYFAAAQFETGSAATAWEIGGGTPVVLVDQLETITPRFPYRNTTLSLLEA